MLQNSTKFLHVFNNPLARKHQLTGFHHMPLYKQA